MNRSTMTNEAPGVFRTTNAIPILGSEDLMVITEAASDAPKRRARICTHAGDGASVHEMFIALRRDGYIRPHKHLHVHESTHLVSGEIQLLIFSDDGTVEHSVRMGSFDSGSPFYYRIPPGKFHALVILSEVALIHEVIEGPRNPAGSVFADWAPDDTAADAGILFLRSRIA